jgi:hypothetical protein
MAGDCTHSFVGRLAESAGTVYLSVGLFRGHPTWHYVRVDPRKRPQFLQQVRTGTIDVAEFGDVLFSGWGTEPPEDIRLQVETVLDRPA